MSILDRYVARRFASAYGLCLLSFGGLFLMFDMFQHLSDFLDSSEALAAQGESLVSTVLRFYATKLPEIFLMLAPFMTLFATIVTVMGFQRTNELTAMIASGRSTHRILAPIYAIAVAFALLHMATAEFVAPPAAREHALLRRIFKNEGELIQDRVPHLRDGANIYSADAWLPDEDTLRGVTCTRFTDPREPAEGRSTLPPGAFEADELRFRIHEGEEGWFPLGGRLAPDGTDEQGRALDVMDLPLDETFPLLLSAGEVNLSAEREEAPGGFTWRQLLALRERFPDQRAQLSNELYTRLSRPLASLVLVLLALPFVCGGGHRSVAYGLGVALGCCVAYIAVEILCTELGNQGHLDPLIAAWLTTTFYGAIGLARLDLVSG